MAIKVMVGTNHGLYEHTLQSVMPVVAYAVVEGKIWQGMGDDAREALCDLALRLQEYARVEGLNLDDPEFEIVD